MTRREISNYDHVNEPFQEWKQNALWQNYILHIFSTKGM
jgi:hypothetical protein